MARTVAIASLIWGDRVVAVRTIQPNESTSLGGGPGALATVPSEVFPRADECRVRVWPDGVATLSLPAGVVAKEAGRTHVGPSVLRIDRGSSAVIDLGSPGDACSRLGLQVEVCAVEEDSFAPVLRPFGGARAHVLLVAAVHALALCAAPAWGMDAERTEREQVYEMARALAKSEDRPPPDLPEALPERPKGRDSAAGRALASPVVGSRRLDPADPTAVELPGVPEARPATVPASDVRARTELGNHEAGLRSVPGAAPLIDRVVRQNASRFVACGELARAAGREAASPVQAELVIVGGRVVEVTDAGSKGSDPTLVACVLDAFAGLGFPTLPEDAPLRERYTIWLSPR